MIVSSFKVVSQAGISVSIAKKVYDTIMLSPTISSAKGDRLFFDAILRQDHQSTLTITSHPIQNSANVADHAYMNPLELNMEIGMSDAMISLRDIASIQGAIGAVTSLNPFQTKTRSYNTYQTLKKLQADRQPLTVTTRLNTYTNMLIARMNARDDYQTATGLRCDITFQQLLIGYISTTSIIKDAQEQIVGTTK